MAVHHRVWTIVQCPACGAEGNFHVSVEAVDADHQDHAVGDRADGILDGVQLTDGECLACGRAAPFEVEVLGGSVKRVDLVVKAGRS